MLFVFICASLALLCIILDALIEDEILFFKVVSGIFTFCCMVYAFIYVNEPTAMDVYKGNAKLTYKGYYNDSIFIKTDSIVEFTTRRN